MSVDNLLEVRNLNTSFHLRETVVPVVEGVSLDVRRGEVLGIIGESGSGKTVTCLSLLRLLPDHATIEADSIWFDGEDIAERSDDAFEPLRGRRLAMIFQDPVGSFNPVKTVGWHFRHASRRVAQERPELFATRDGWRREAIAVLERVGIPNGGQMLRNYPHQLSGGMLQRALVALVMQLRPALIIADEPTTNLDNIVEHQIIELFRSLKDEIQSSFIFITHDMSVAAKLCDRIAVMYAGQIVEIGTSAEILAQPQHPYSQGLVRTSSELVRRVDRLQEIPGELPHWRSMPEGCRFHPRCAFARAGCERDQALRSTGGGRVVRCLLYEDVP